jgi:hypothetical protein
MIRRKSRRPAADPRAHPVSGAPARVTDTVAPLAHIGAGPVRSIRIAAADLGVPTTPRPVAPAAPTSMPGHARLPDRACETQVRRALEHRQRVVIAGPETVDPDRAPDDLTPSEAAENAAQAFQWADAATDLARRATLRDAGRTWWRLAHRMHRAQRHRHP